LPGFVVAVGVGVGLGETVVDEHFAVKDQVTVEGAVVVRSVHVRPYEPSAGAWKVSPSGAAA
jgi:hypothetical protein